MPPRVAPREKGQRPPQSAREVVSTPAHSAGVRQGTYGGLTSTQPALTDSARPTRLCWRPGERGCAALAAFLFCEKGVISAKQEPEQCAVLSAPEPIPYPDRVVIVLAVRSGCNVSIETERRIRGDERARVVDRLRTLGINVISRHPSRRRVATRAFRCPADLVAEVRRDERLLITRELRREARISSALGLG